MRIFIAAELPEEVKEYLFSLQKEIGGSLAKINWVHKKNIHLTLKFLGDVSESLVEDIKKRISMIRFKRFVVRTSGIGVFPSESFVRVVWVGLEPEGKIIELQQKVDEALLDMFHEEQKFQAHLTLGRVKFVKKKREFIERIKNLKVKPVEVEISEIKLIESELTKDGPVYKEIFSVKALD